MLNLELLLKKIKQYKWFILLILCVSLCYIPAVYPQPAGKGIISVKTLDNIVETYPYQVKVWSGSLIDNNDGTVTVSVGANQVTEPNLSIDNSTTDEYVLSWEDDTNQFSWKVDATGAGGAFALVDATDVNSSTATSGNMLMADGASWHSVTLSGDITGVWNGVMTIGDNKLTLDELTNVNTATATAGNIIVADGNSWNTTALSGAVSLTSAGVTDIVANQISLTDLSDVNTATTTSGLVLMADGTDFEATNIYGRYAQWSNTQHFLDDTGVVMFGTTSQDVIRHNQYTDGTGQGRDSLQIGIPVGAVPNAGYLTLLEKADIDNANQQPINSTANPTLRIYSADETVTQDFIEFYHNQTNAVINIGNGDLIVSGDPVDFGAATSFEIPNDGTTNETGEIAINTTIGSHQPLLQYYDGDENLYVVAMPTAALTTTDGHFVKYNATNDEFEMGAGSGGSTQLTDLSDVNTATATAGFILVADGTDFEGAQITGDIKLWSGGRTAVEGYLNLPVQSAKISDSNTAAYVMVSGDAVIDGGTGTFKLRFDTDSDDQALWSFKVPGNFVETTAVVKMDYTTNAVAASVVGMEVDIMCVSDGDAVEFSLPSFDTANDVTGGTTVPATAGYLDTISISLTNADSMVAGDACMLRIIRDVDDDDDAAADVWVQNVQLQYNAF